jgi:molecular chaperone DnaK
MVKEAERFAQDDEKRKEEAELKNQADTLAYTTEKGLKEFGEKVSPSDRAQVEEKLKGLKEALKGSDPAAIKKGMEELTRVSHKLAEEVYKAASAKGGPGAGSSGGNGPGQSQAEPKGKKEDVIDAEFKADDEKR